MEMSQALGNIKTNIITMPIATVGDRAVIDDLGHGFFISVTYRDVVYVR